MDIKFVSDDKVCENDFNIIGFLGKGYYGKVLKVRKNCDKDKNQLYAMKIVNKNKILGKAKKIEHALSEKNILQIVNHSFIVKMLYSFQSETKLFYILEYACGEDLEKLLIKEKLLSTSPARFYITEIILAVEYLHFHDIIFRDLKPANILLDKDGHIKIVDFGLSKENMIDGQRTYSKCGTLSYAAPEIVSNDGHGKEVDWWSLGVVIYRMLVGELPFSDSHGDFALAQSIVTGNYTFPSDFSGKSSERDLISLLLIVNPDLRLGSSGANEVKKHKFFKCVSWNKVLKRLETPPFLTNPESSSDSSEYNYENMLSKNSSDDDSLVSTASDSQNVLFKEFSFTCLEMLDSASNNIDTENNDKNQEKPYKQNSGLQRN